MESPSDNRIIVFGSGGHAKSVISVIEAEAKWQIHGLLSDPNFQTNQEEVLGYKILGDRGSLSDLIKEGINKAIVAIGDNQIRASIADDLVSRGITLINTIHPSAIIFNGSEIGKGTFIHAQTLIGADCRIGENVIVSVGSVVGHDSIVGNHVQLTPGVLIGGNARIGDYSFFGMGSVVFPQVKTGRNVKVGANSVVRKDLDDNLTIVGNPPRIIKRE